MSKSGWARYCGSSSDDAFRPVVRGVEIGRLIKQSVAAYLQWQTYFLPGLVCARALPATDLALLLERRSLRILLALVATAFEVCLEFLAISIHLLSLSGIVKALYP